MYDFCKFFLEEVNVRKKNIQDLETLQFLLAFRNYATSLSSIIRIKKLDFRSYQKAIILKSLDNIIFPNSMEK